MRLAHGCHVACLAAMLCIGGTAQAAPQRVVSTFLCTDEYVFRLVPRERIAALSFLAADRHPVVSTIADDVKGIRLIRGSAEEVLSLNPDLVVMYQGTNPKLKAHLDDAKIAVLEVPWANSLAQIRDITKMLGEKLGAPARAKELIARMDRELADAERVVPRPVVRALIYEPNGYATASGVSNEILRAAGLLNAAPGMNQTRLGTVPVEAVVAMPPELLILNGEREASPTRADMILKHPALSALKEHTLVANASLTPLLCPGPWSAAVAPELAKIGRRARVLAPAKAAN